MRKMAATKCLLALGCWILGTQAQAQTLSERVQILESKMEERKAQAEDAIGLDFNALVSTTYNYSINNPGSGNDIGMRIYNKKQNQLDLRDDVLSVSRLREDEAFGFSIAMDFRKTAVQGNGTDYRFTDPDVISTEFLVTL